MSANEGREAIPAVVEGPPVRTLPEVATPALLTHSDIRKSGRNMRAHDTLRGDDQKVP